MAPEYSAVESPQRRTGLLRDQVQLLKKENSRRYEIAPIQECLSFEKGFFIVVRACQLLSQNNEGTIFVGIAGPSGAGKTIFTEKVLNFMPSVAVLSMDSYNDASRIIDGNYDDPRLTDYDTLLANIHGLKNGGSVQVPIYDFKESCRTGYRTVEAPSSRIVIIEGIYALSEKLQSLLDLRVSVTGGIHFDLVKRVLRDIQRAGQEPEEIIHQISETVYPMYKAFIEPDLRTAHIKIRNKFNPFTGFQNPTYILKSRRSLPVDKIKDVLSKDHNEKKDEIYDIYLLPPGEDPEACQSYLRMRNRDGIYNLMFEEWVTDSPFIISPRISFEVSVRLLGGLMALGYTIAAILKRSSLIFSDDSVSVKIDWLEQLNRHYVQVQGRDRLTVKRIAEQLGLDGSYTARTYIEQIQLEKLIKEVTNLPDDLKMKLSRYEESTTSPREVLSKAFGEKASTRKKHLRSTMSHSYSSHCESRISNLTRLLNGIDEGSEKRISESSDSDLKNDLMDQLTEKILTLSERMDAFTSQLENMNFKLTTQQFGQMIPSLDGGEFTDSMLTTHLSTGLEKTSYLKTSNSFPQLAMEEIVGLTEGQLHILHQLKSLSKVVNDCVGNTKVQKKSTTGNKFLDAADFVGRRTIVVLAVGGFSTLLCKFLYRR